MYRVQVTYLRSGVCDKHNLNVIFEVEGDAELGVQLAMTVVRDVLDQKERRTANAGLIGRWTVEVHHGESR